MTQLEYWVFKAEGDFELAKAAKRLRAKPQPDGVCFHSQQCAEKYLKGFLEQHGDTPPKVHDLPLLLTMCVNHDPMLIALTNAVEFLDQFSVRVRYPGEVATSEDAVDAIAAMNTVRRVLQSGMGLK